jgi:SAM-dependent methyltransferase
LAEVHPIRGELTEAEERYRLASEWSHEPQPGLALLRLAAGSTDAAQAAIDRVVAECTDRLRRSRLLPAQVEIALAAGDVYAVHGDRWEAMMAPYGQAMLEAAALRPGERVLDVGCGHGYSTFAAAEQVAPGGTVLGVDISPEMLAPAHPRAAAMGNLALLVADAQVHPFPPGSFDAVISRFGTMFFEDPHAAFSNLHTALRPGGRTVFVCWQDPLKSEWLAVSFGVAIPLVGKPPELSPPGAPGPFAFADGNRLRQLITTATRRASGRPGTGKRSR